MGNKGGRFERDVCHKLSAWWTGDDKAAVFWRTGGSGARATVRGAHGRDTAGQHGDIGATDPCGKPLIDLLTIELKRGYSAFTIHDLFDRPDYAAQQTMEAHFQQAIEAQRACGTLSWLLITQRDRRDPLVWGPAKLLEAFRSVGAFYNRPCPNISFGVRLRLYSGKAKTKTKVGTMRLSVFSTTLDNFLASITPNHIRELLD